MENNQPDYKRIYSDILDRMFPDKKEQCMDILNKKIISHLDVIKINTMIFGSVSSDISDFNQRHRFYNKSAILEILDYQKKNRLNNSQLARHFKLSRNTVTKWKKKFIV